MGRGTSRGKNSGDEQRKGRGDQRSTRRDDYDDVARDDSAEFAAYDDSGVYDAYDTGYDDYDAPRQGGRALVAADDSERLPAAYAARAVEPVIIRGSGVAMGMPFIKRRERPLTMRLAMLTLAACIVVTGLFAVTPLGTSANGNLSTFQALSGAVVLHHDPTYQWYVVQWGDTVESIAEKKHIQIGGIYELNDLLAGQEITVGKAYKIPDDPYYGKDYRPAAFTVRGNGSTVFGSNWWNAVAGDPLPEASCAPDGNGDPAGYQLVAPNPGAYFVRGFSWFHDGVDLSAPEGNPIHAAQNGQVIWAGYDATNGFGWSVKINHCHHLSTIYGHMDGVNVHIGQNVKAGDVIGIEGNTGWSTGPHLHMTVQWNNYAVDPLPYYSWDFNKLLHA